MMPNLPAHRFDLHSEWVVEGSVEEVSEALGDVERLTDWWSAVYLSVDVQESGNSKGIGRRIAFHSKGWLPYTLNWQGEVIEADPPTSWKIKATGDLTGTGRWHLRQRGANVIATYDWQVDVDQPWMRRLAPLLKPVFAANHRWAMAQGLKGLKGELKRRRGS